MDSQPLRTQRSLLDAPDSLPGRPLLCAPSAPKPPAVPYRQGMASLATRMPRQPASLRRRALVGLRGAEDLSDGQRFGLVVLGTVASGALMLAAGYAIGRMTA